MKDLNAPIQFPDDVDRMVDKLLSDPSRVDDIKAELRRRLGASNTPPRKVYARQPADQDDPWDNLPV